MRLHRRSAILTGVVMAGLLLASSGAAQPGRGAGNYVIGPQDVLSIAVWNQDNVSGQYAVDGDGTFTFPLVGRVDATGLTLRALELELTRLLADGFFRNPQVTISVAEYRSKRIFVVGELHQPGTYPLIADMSLIEALASAGSTTPAAADHALVIRAAHADGPVLPGQDRSAEVIRADLATLRRGELSQNVALRDGDTVFVPRVSTVYVSGHVRNPGAYAMAENVTVLQALSLAGGVTEYGATNRVTIVRIIDGEERELKVSLGDPVQPGDTIMVPERYF